MAYVIIQGRSLAGHSLGAYGGVRGQRDGLGPHFWPDGRGGFSGLGAVPVSDADARKQLESLFVTAMVNWFTTLSKAIDDSPVFAFAARDALRKAQNQISGRGQPGLANVRDSGISLIRDTSVPLNEVERRINEFTTSYSGDVAATLTAAQQLGHRASFLGILQAFRDAMRTVIRAVLAEAADTARTVAKGLPVWVLVAGGLLVVGYAATAVRSLRGSS